MGDKIRRFRDLKVYQLSFSLQQEIFEKSKGFPKEELFHLRIRFGDLRVLSGLTRQRHGINVVTKHTL